MNAESSKAAIISAETPRGTFESMCNTDRTLIQIKLYEAKLWALELAELIRRENRRGRLHVSTNLLDGYGVDADFDEWGI